MIYKRPAWLTKKRTSIKNIIIISLLCLLTIVVVIFAVRYSKSGVQSYLKLTATNVPTPSEADFKAGFPIPNPVEDVNIDPKPVEPSPTPTPQPTPEPIVQPLPVIGPGPSPSPSSKLDPDATEVFVFAELIPNTGKKEIFIYDCKTKKKVQISNVNNGSIMNTSRPRFTPCGTAIMFVRYNQYEKTYTIWYKNPSDVEPIIIYASKPNYSITADGTKIVFVSQKNTIATIPISGGESTDILLYEGRKYDFPILSSDSSTLYYVLEHGIGYGLYKKKLDPPNSSTSELILAGQNRPRSVELSPDGNYFLITFQPDHDRLSIFNIVTGKVINLKTDNNSPFLGAIWSKSGKFIYTSKGSPHRKINRMEFDQIINRKNNEPLLSDVVATDVDAMHLDSMPRYEKDYVAKDKEVARNDDEEVDKSIDESFRVNEAEEETSDTSEIAEDNNTEIVVTETTQAKEEPVSVTEEAP